MKKQNNCRVIVETNEQPKSKMVFYKKVSKVFVHLFKEEEKEIIRITLETEK